jgi:hypothetical protein
LTWATIRGVAPTPPTRSTNYEAGNVHFAVALDTIPESGAYKSQMPEPPGRVSGDASKPEPPVHDSSIYEV